MIPSTGSLRLPCSHAFDYALNKSPFAKSEVEDFIAVCNV